MSEGAGRKATAEAGIRKVVAESELTEMTLRAIEVYQTQGQLLDRLWAYFSQYSAVLILIGLVAVPFGQQLKPVVPWWVLAVPLIAYLALCRANHLAVKLTLDELELLREVAVQKTRLPFTGSPKGKLLRWHLASVGLTVAIYLVCWIYIKW